MAVFEHEKCFIWVFLVFSFLVFSVFKYLKSSFSSNFPDLEMLQFWSVNYLCQACKLYFHFGHVQNFGQYVFLVNSESVLRLVLLNIYCIAILPKTVVFCTFWRLKILVLWRKIVQNILIFVYLFCPKNSATDFTKTIITQEWLVVESCPVPRRIVLLMFYQLVYNIRSHFNELILAWSA